MIIYKFFPSGIIKQATINDNYVVFLACRDSKTENYYLDCFSLTGSYKLIAKFKLK